jgi:hypothetical protein
LLVNPPLQFTIFYYYFLGFEPNLKYKRSIELDINAKIQCQFQLAKLLPGQGV